MNVGDQMVFQRYEIKYLLNPTQKAALLEAMAPQMALDQYGRTTVRSIYYDTDTYRLIRRSIERPVYKEKLRLRSYRQAGMGDPIFVELKKKYRSVVYKRRLSLSQGEALDCLATGSPLPVASQIADEIDYFRRYYGRLIPAAFLSYEREAYYALDGSELRVTFDENILARFSGFSFQEGIYGTPLLNREATLMEIKTAGGLPLWLSHCLSSQRAFKTSFSKYGSAYQRLILPALEGGRRYA